MSWETYSLSNRGKGYVTMQQHMTTFAELACNLGRYDEKSNREGLIHLGLCENKVVDDLVLPRVSQCLKIEDKDTRYFPFEGSVRFRNSLARFFERYMKPAEPIQPDDIFVINGCAALAHCLASVLCDAGDGILVPTPYYYSYDADFTLQPQVLCYPVHLSSQADPGSTETYELTISKLQDALDKAKSENVKIRALVLCNPHNPLGIVYSKKLIEQCLEFAQRNSLHVISDEMYMFTVYGDCQWVSTASFHNVIDPNLLHIMYGFSKDFGLSGLRVGVLFSRNHGVIEAMRAISYYHAVPPIIQNSLHGLVDDYDWLDTTFVPTLHERLRLCLATVAKAFHRLKVPIINPSAGLYVWANFSHHLKPPTFENERALNDMFIKNGVLLTPGSIYSSAEPGWFRLVFSTHMSVLETAMQRIATALDSFAKHENTLSTGVSCSSDISLEELVGTLKAQIEQSDWLKENTAGKWVAENPELAKEFMGSKNRAT